MKAIVLISGGLDSILAARIVREQGIDILPFNFKIPFSSAGVKADERLARLEAGLGSQIMSVDISQGFLGLLLNPKHGFGANMNPCIDCKILMLRRARELMKERQAEFVVTGEVLGQRPMSQNSPALRAIEAESGLERLILRPLSARLLPQTIPEEKAWVSRERLLDINGRGRRRQLELAEDFGIEGYAAPAGGCLLTDSGFSRRLKDIIAHKELSLDNIELLKVGRHFRLNPEAKLVVGRDEAENNCIVSLAREGDYLFLPDERIAGPTSLGRGLFDQEMVRLACSITSRYCDLDNNPNAEIIYAKMPNKEEGRLGVFPIPEENLAGFRI